MAWLVLTGAMEQVDPPCTGCGSSCGLYTDATGFISDGSESLDYADDAECQWIIAPGAGRMVTITFWEFDSESCCDAVTVGACEDMSCQTFDRLGMLNGYYDEPQSFTSTTGFLTVIFESDSSVFT
jgi:hypothetical protein